MSVSKQESNKFQLFLGMIFLLVSITLSILLSQDRKSTRLNSSHSSISYAVFCLKKKRIETPGESELAHDNFNRGFTAKCLDRVEFFFSANVGESPHPLARVSSGGEASRLMLILT